MKLSIIIPCYNERNTILSLIEAVKNSPIKNRELIIVDDGSEDGTRPWPLLPTRGQKSASFKMQIWNMILRNFRS